MGKGAVTLGDLRGRPAMLEIACEKCGRKGRLSVARLIGECGEDMGLPTLLATLCRDSPKRRGYSVYDRCAAALAPTVKNASFAVGEDDFVNFSCILPVEALNWDIDVIPMV